MQGAAEVLILVVLPSSPIEPIASRISSDISQLLPSGGHLDIWPMRSDDSLLRGVRSAECKIFERRDTMDSVPEQRQGRKRWKLW